MSSEQNDPDKYMEVDDPVIKNRLRTLAREITAWLPAKFGFTLFIFGYGAHAPLFYISSASRDDMIKTTKEWLASQEKIRA